MGWSESLQLAGGACELLGLAFVIRGMDRRSREAGKGSLWQRLFGRHEPIVRSGTASISATGSNTSHGYGELTSNASLEERVQHLEQQLRNQGRTIHEVRRELETETSARKAAVAEIEVALEGVRKSIQPLIAEAAVSDLKNEAIGVSLFVLGVVLATVGGVLG